MREVECEVCVSWKNLDSDEESFELVELIHERVNSGEEELHFGLSSYSLLVSELVGMD